jgi:hypothetical protein
MFEGTPRSLSMKSGMVTSVGINYLPVCFFTHQLFPHDQLPKFFHLLELNKIVSDISIQLYILERWGKKQEVFAI